MTETPMQVIQRELETLLDYKAQEGLARLLERNPQVVKDALLECIEQDPCGVYDFPLYRKACERLKADSEIAYEMVDKDWLNGLVKDVVEMSEHF